MNRIKILSDSVKKKISAGEVVEGPFSVVKELVENSIDAGATEINVQVIESGMKKIQVNDNGSGINRDDVELAIAEHATSKISEIYDIDHISSYGFRGEALSSVSSISSMTILTRTADEDTGIKLVSGDDGVKKSDYAGPAGTTVIVENLFYNTPARKKFLKNRSTELRYIREIILSISLSNPGVHFSLDVDSSRQVTLTPAADLEERVKQVYGKGIMENLYYERLQDLKVNIYGFLSKPGFLKSNRSMQKLFINNRPVEYKYLGFILSRAYEAVAMKGSHPAAIIFIDIDPELIDVNIHPAKREVKLFDQKYIDSIIYHLAEKSLNRQHDISDKLFAPPQEIPGKTFSEQNTENRVLPGIDMFSSVNKTAQAIESPASFVREVSGLYQDIENERNIKIIGIAFNTYIIFEYGDSLHFIDFHAAHERKIYNDLIQKESGFESQELAFPRVLEFSIDEHRLIIENVESFNEIGFDIDDFSDNSITIRSVPEIARNIDAENVFREFIDSLKDDGGKEFDISKRVAAAVACHSARRAGDRLDPDEMRMLINEAIDETADLRCPHGRPYMYKIKKYDLERMFKRQ